MTSPISDEVQLTETHIIPSPICGAFLTRSALYLKTATNVAAIENEAKSVVTSPAIRATPTKPGRERNVTAALNTIAA
jgi:hypothetical protein